MKRSAKTAAKAAIENTSSTFQDAPTSTRLSRLEQDNYISLTQPSQSYASKKGATEYILHDKKKRKKRLSTIFSSVKQLGQLISESRIERVEGATYLTAGVVGKGAELGLCEVCGYEGRYRCNRCKVGSGYCSIVCRGVHYDTKCSKI